jgi:hypothetical protein
MCSKYVVTMLQLKKLNLPSMMCAETISPAYFSCIFNVRAPTCIVPFLSGDAFWLWMHSGVSGVIEVRLDYSDYLLVSYCGISGTWTHNFRYVNISQAYSFNIYDSNSFRYEAKLVWNSLTNETRIMTYVYLLQNYVNIWSWRKNVNIVHAMCCLTTDLFFLSCFNAIYYLSLCFLYALIFVVRCFYLIHAWYCILLALLFCVHIPTLNKAYLPIYLMTVMFVYQYIPYNKLSIHNKEEI